MTLWNNLDQAYQRGNTQASSLFWIGPFTGWVPVILAAVAGAGFRQLVFKVDYCV
jgi:hypothetical protein